MIFGKRFYTFFICPRSDPCSDKKRLISVTFTVVITQFQFITATNFWALTRCMNECNMSRTRRQSFYFNVSCIYVIYATQYFDVKKVKLFL
jgi:hypothetical protein